MNTSPALPQLHLLDRPPGWRAARPLLTLIAVFAVFTALVLTSGQVGAKAADGAMQVPVSGKVTSIVGAGCPGSRPDHAGIDMATPVGTPVYAAYDGTATRRSDPSGYGTYLTIEHSDGYRTLYGHLSGYTVNSGDRVFKGQQVAWSGNTGSSDGPHLHFEVRRGGVAQNFINSYFRCGMATTAGAPIAVNFPDLPAGFCGYPVYGAILDKYLQWGATSGVLGCPVNFEFRPPDNVGYIQIFAGGSIYWHPNTGAHVIRGALRAKWGDLGYERSFLGYPTTDEFCNLAGSGCGQGFVGGSIYWSPGTEAHFTRGLIRDKWGQLGYENSFLGYPTTDEICGLANGGCLQAYVGGSIYFSPSTGAHFTRGAIREKYSQLGWENSFLSYPTTDEFCGLVRGGCGQVFTGGSIYWSPASGTHTVYGAIGGKWAQLGYENSSLGYPRSDEYSIPGGRAQDFEGGRIVWDSVNGARVG